MTKGICIGLLSAPEGGGCKGRGRWLGPAGLGFKDDGKKQQRARGEGRDRLEGRGKGESRKDEKSGKGQKGPFRGWPGAGRMYWRSAEGLAACTRCNTFFSHPPS